MTPFTNLTSTVVPLPLKDVDTDMIIPAQYLTSTTTNLEFWGGHLFERLKAADPDFPTSQEKFKNGQILVARSNFGCGSSREHAVWSLLGDKFRVVIAPSFADIFFSNSAKNGLVLIKLDEKIVEEILDKSKNGDFEIEVDLPNQQIKFENQTYDFPFDQFRKDCIIKGLDDLDYILSHEKEIDDWNQNKEQYTFYSTLKPNR